MVDFDSQLTVSFEDGFIEGYLTGVMMGYSQSSSLLEEE